MTAIRPENSRPAVVMCSQDQSDDALFDAVYPEGIRLVSRRFWTPVAVARRAAEFLRGAGARRVLDVGAGVGKFVLAAASTMPKLEFVGVEQRAHLVEVARSARRRLRVSNAHFRVAEATAMSWDGFDAFYFFNPLAENLFDEENWLDDRVELTKERFAREVLRVECALRRAPLGTLVVTYHGSSGRIPGCYELQACEPAGSDRLRLWMKRRENDDGSFFVEVGDGIVWHQRGAGDGFPS
jgi:SAM-dependent methyltransferase